MTYELTYKDLTEMFHDLMISNQDYFLSQANLGAVYKEAVADSWLSEFDESTLEEAERLNVILPLIKWCIKYGIMTDNLEGELSLYYKDYLNGKLDDLLADYEAEAVIADLIWCYKSHFATM